MAFFDDLSKKVTKLGQDVSQKTQTFTDGVKINSQISDQKKSLSRLYEDLGRILYNEETTRSNSKCQNILGMIESGEKNLQELERQLSANKGEVTCKNCGAGVPSGNAFCQNCGTKVEVPVQEPVNNEPEQSVATSCSKCGQTVEQGASFCTNCGTPVNK